MPVKQTELMKYLTESWLSLVGRLVACLFLVVLLPALILIALFIQRVAGSPIIVADQSPSGEGPRIRRRYRFRTTGRGSSVFHTVGRFLRSYSIDELPALWSVARGDIGLRGFFRLR